MTITNNIRISAVFAAFVLIASVLAVAPAAHAADLPVDDGFYPIGEENFYNPTYSGGGGDIYPIGEEIYSTPSNYFGSYDSGYGASYSGFGGGYSFGGGGSSWTPSYFGGSSGFGGQSGYSSSLVSNNGNSYINAPTTVNAPTTITNSGNTTITNPYVGTPVVYTQPPVYYTPPSYPVYPQPTRQPYVSLTAVPYTGLDLGPIGTVLYWSFLVLWCLVAAYLIIVKKVQNKIVSGLNAVLFGNASHSVAHTPVQKSYNKAVAAHSKAAVEEDAIDPFILSQINRA